MLLMLRNQCVLQGTNLIEPTSHARKNPESQIKAREIKHNCKTNIFASSSLPVLYSNLTAFKKLFQYYVTNEGMV